MSLNSPLRSFVSMDDLITVRIVGEFKREGITFRLQACSPYAPFYVRFCLHNIGEIQRYLDNDKTEFSYLVKYEESLVELQKEIKERLNHD